jgi:O-antigen ligase
MTRRVDLLAWIWPAVMACAGAFLGLVAVLNPLLAIGGALAIAFIALTIADLTVGVALFTFVAFLLEVVPGIEGIPAAKLVGFVLVFSWLAISATSPGGREQLASVHPGLLVLGGLFLTWVAASALWTEDTAATITSWYRFAPNLLLVPIVYAAVRDRRDLWLIVAVFVAGALVSTFYGAFVAPGDADAAAEGRLTGSGVDPNYLAASLVAALALCGGAMATRAHGAGVRLLAGGGAVLLLLALVLTASRTGIVALVVAAIVAVLIAGRGRRFPALLMAVTILGLGGLYIAVAAPDVQQRLTSIGSGTGRTDIWTVGMRMVRDKPLTGVGAGNYPIASIHYLLEPGSLLRDDFIVDTPKVAHNIYLESAAELGLPGLALLLAIIGYSGCCALRAAGMFRRARDVPLELLSRSVVVALAGMLAAAFFNSLQYQKTIWLMLALGPCLLAVARRERVAA